MSWDQQFLYQGWLFLDMFTDWKVWELILVQGVLFGIGAGILYFPVIFWVRFYEREFIDSFTNGSMNVEVLLVELFSAEVDSEVLFSHSWQIISSNQLAINGHYEYGQPCLRF